MMRRDPGDSGSTHSSRTGSNASLSKKSDTSSGIVSDDPPSLRSRRDSELETAINALHELNIRENAKCKLNEEEFSCRVEKECMGGGFQGCQLVRIFRISYGKSVQIRKYDLCHSEYGLRKKKKKKKKNDCRKRL